jgi:hypothetical protein
VSKRSIKVLKLKLPTEYLFILRKERGKQKYFGIIVDCYFKGISR